MDWRVDGSQKLDMKLKERMQEKIEDGSLTVDDLLDFFTLFIQTANDSEDARDEVAGYDRAFQFVIRDYRNIWFTVRKQVFEMGLGELESPDITLEMDKQLLLSVFSGRKDPTAAYMCGELKVNGNLNDAVKFRTILEVVQDELE